MKALNSLGRKIKNPANLSIKKNSIKITNIQLFASCILALVAIVCWSFYPALDNDFVHWDDQYYITDNPLIYTPSIENLQLLLTKIISLNYHPLTMISLWINAYMSGTASAFPFIVTNILVHLINTILVFFFIKKISNDKLIVAFTTALIFGIHPMHVESVVWISERKDVLYTFFFLLSSISYVNFIDQKNNRYLVVSFLFFVFACLSKAMAVSLVPILYLIDYYKNRKLTSYFLHLEKIPFIIFALLVGSIAMDVQAGGDFLGLLEPSSDAKALSSDATYTLIERFQFACYGLFFYIQKFFFPFNLAAFHPYAPVVNTNYLPLISILSLGLIGSLIYTINKFKKIAFGGFFFLFTLLLVLQFIQVGSAIVAERYTYIPYIGLGFLLGLFIESLLKNKSKVILLFILFLITTYFSFLTRKQVDLWQNHVSLFQNVVNLYPSDPYSREYLATGLWLEGKQDEAIVHLEYAINKLHYLQSTSFELLANCWADKNDPDKALAFYDKAIELNPQNYVAYYHRGLLLVEIDPKAAIADFNFCEQSNHDYIKQIRHEPRARCYGIIGELEKSIAGFTEAIKYDPISEIYFNRGLSYERLGQLEEAIADYKTSLELDPTALDVKERLEKLEKQRN